MKKHTINFQKKFDSNGYVYDQTVNISQTELLAINEHITALENNEDFLDTLACEKRSFVTPLIVINEKIAFTTHTVRNIIADFLNITLKNRNTCFVIN
jgi:hypothetical protein